MDNVRVVRVGLNRWEYSPAVDWPAEPVNFFAVSPMDVRMNDEWAAMTVSYNHTDGGNGAFFRPADTDLLVAVRMLADQSSGRIRLNFRHALARISLSVKTSHVEGQAVRIGRVSFEGRAEGTLRLPNQTTSPETFDGSLIHNWTIWNTHGNSLILYEATEGYLALTEAPIALLEAGKYVVPDFLTPIHNSGEVTGQRFDVYYQIVDSRTGERLWPNEHTDWWDLATPSSREWGVGRYALYGHTPDNTLLPGYHYRYTLTIDKASHLPSRSGEDASSLSVEVQPY